MGSRANIYVVQHLHGENPEGGIFLYTHWGGSNLPTVLQAALKRGQDRWKDEPYLTRIIMCEMIDREEWSDTTGYGISTYLGDNEYPILVVDCIRGLVGVAEPGTKSDENTIRWRLGMPVLI